MSFTFCSSEAIVTAAGDNVNSIAAASYAVLSQYSNDAEGTICMATRYDWITNYPSESSYAKLTLANAASAYGGIKLINYNMAGIGRVEAESRINVLYDAFLYCVKILKAYKKPEDSK